MASSKRNDHTRLDSPLFRLAKFDQTKCFYTCVTHDTIEVRQITHRSSIEPNNSCTSNTNDFYDSHTLLQSTIGREQASSIRDIDTLVSFASSSGVGQQGSSRSANRPTLIVVLACLDNCGLLALVGRGGAKGIVECQRARPCRGKVQSGATFDDNQQLERVTGVQHCGFVLSSTGGTFYFLSLGSLRQFDFDRCPKPVPFTHAIKPQNLGIQALSRLHASLNTLWFSHPTNSYNEIGRENNIKPHLLCRGSNYVARNRFEIFTLGIDYQLSLWIVSSDISLPELQRSINIYSILCEIFQDVHLQFEVICLGVYDNSIHLTLRVCQGGGGYLSYILKFPMSDFQVGKVENYNLIECPIERPLIAFDKILLTHDDKDICTYCQISTNQKNNDSYFDFILSLWDNKILDVATSQTLCYVLTELQGLKIIPMAINENSSATIDKLIDSLSLQASELFNRFEIPQLKKIEPLLNLDNINVMKYYAQIVEDVYDIPKDAEAIHQIIESIEKIESMETKTVLCFRLLIFLASHPASESFVSELQFDYLTLIIVNFVISQHFEKRVYSSFDFNKDVDIVLDQLFAFHDNSIDLFVTWIDCIQKTLVSLDILQFLLQSKCDYEKYLFCFSKTKLRNHLEKLCEKLEEFTSLGHNDSKDYAICFIHFILKYILKSYSQNSVSFAINLLRTSIGATQNPSKLIELAIQYQIYDIVVEHYYNSHDFSELSNLINKYPAIIEYLVNYSRQRDELHLLVTSNCFALETLLEYCRHDAIIYSLALAKCNDIISATRNLLEKCLLNKNPQLSLISAQLWYNMARGLYLCVRNTCVDENKFEENLYIIKASLDFQLHLSQENGDRFCNKFLSFPQLVKEVIKLFKISDSTNCCMKELFDLSLSMDTFLNNSQDFLKYVWQSIFRDFDKKNICVILDQCERQIKIQLLLLHDSNQIEATEDIGNYLKYHISEIA